MFQKASKGQNVAKVIITTVGWGVTPVLCNHPEI